MIYLLLVLSIFLAVFKSSVYNHYAKGDSPDTNGVFRYNAVCYGIAAVVALIVGIGSSLSAGTFWVAILYAVVVFSMQALSISAMTIGPMGATSLLLLYGMIIPSVAGPIFWHEPFSIWQGVGVLLVLFSMWLLGENNPEDKSANKKWIILALLCFLFSGLAGLSEKIHQSTDGRNERMMFLFIACVFMLAFSLIGMLFVKKTPEKKTNVKSILAHGGISGILVGIYAPINLTLAGSLDSLIYYPVANGGALLLTVIISVLVFREKCTKRRLLGFITGFLSILLLSLPI